jgi:DNA-directed RNA polymerase specialized sigma24 family protein
MEEGDVLRIFAGADEEAARQAWGRLWELNRFRLQGFLIRTLNVDARRDIIEDIIEDVFLKLWDMRPRFEHRGIEAFHGLLYKMVKHRYLDLIRDRQEKAEDVEDWDAIPDSDLSAVGGIVDTVLAEELYHLANVLWLELDPSLSRETHNRQLIAAQLYYLDGEPEEEVLRLLGSPSPVEPPLTRDTLDEWLWHSGVLRHVAYQELYYSNDDLAAYLLNNSPQADWTDAEKTIILWRYRNALLMDQILERKDCPYTQEKLAALLDRLKSCLPFSSQMARVLAGLARAPQRDGRGALSRRGLWQRLAFQYRYGEEIPVRDVQERTQPAAAQVGYEVKFEVLNMWLSGGRLLEQLARFCRWKGEGSADE